MYRNEIPKLINIKWRYEGGGQFIIYQHPITGMLDILNPVASQIFVNCDGTKSVNQICKNLCEEYSNIDQKIIEEDVSRFINYLVKEDLLFLI
ncbi:PqqD family protein [Lachnospiraceae bacterium DSM 108991]|uniref:PqqD family protein n=1 Tax=Claveliimonas monacensis TaxID=2779351 RepID=A0ABR9RM17_9FIRM|nr:PqqD family protein [Claveliimonas monacensis]MBE5064017.1 PqqD family protein [Claveliimonas monacensis]